jgi:uncharacterized protein (TIRG00374 family)
MRNANKLWFILILAAIGYALAVLWRSSGATMAALTRVGVGGITLVLGLSLLNYAVRFLRWQWYLGRLRCRVPAGLSLQYYLAGFAFTATPAKLGEAARSLYLKRHDIPYEQSLALLVAERLTDLVAMTMLASLAFTLLPGYARAGAAVAGAVGVALLLLVIVLGSPGTQRRLAFVRPQRMRRLAGQLSSLLVNARTLIQPAALMYGLILGAIAWAAEGVGLYVILQCLHINIPLAAVIGIYAVSLLVGALSFIPGGLGGTEAAMTLLLVMHGAGQGEALAATLICRVATLWFAVAVGWLTFLRLRVPALPEGPPPRR